MSGMLDVSAMETLPRIFISYSRSDGRAFAEDFERKLKGEGIHTWRDIQDMGSGEILPQVLRAIEHAEHLVLILSQRSLVSDWIKREWSHARIVGKMVSPVLADPAIKRSDLPSWIRREEIWDTASVGEIRVLSGHDDGVNSASFSSDGRRIVTASDDRTARIWDAASGGKIRVLSNHARGVTSASFSSDGRRIVTASDDGTARIWGAASGGKIRVLIGHDGAVTSASFSSDGSRIVTASLDRTARIWDAASCVEIRVLSGHGGGVRGALFSSDGSRIVTASDDRTARIWDAVSGGEIGVLSGHDGGVRGASFSSDGSRIVNASDDRTARIWDAVSGGEIMRISLEAGISALAVLGDAIALGDRLGRIHVFDANAYLTGKEPMRA